MSYLRIVGLVLCSTVPSLGQAIDDLSSQQLVANRYCVKCHGPKIQKGDVRLDRLKALDHATVQAVYEQLADGLMPPADEPQLSSQARKDFVEKLLAKAKENSQVLSSGLRRLNKREYGNTVRDLLGLNQGIYDPSEFIYRDEIDEGFDTAAESLVISNELLMEYMEAADKSLRHALFTDAVHRPEPQRVNVNIKRMKGVGGSRYIQSHKEYIICRSGGKAMVYDGQSSRQIKIPGRYTITVTAAAIDRDTYPVRFAPEKGPVIMGLGVQQDAAASVSTKPVVLKTFELQDDVDRTYSVDVWIDKGHFPYLSFVNGSSKPITQLRSNIRRRKIDPSAMKKPYRGPGIRISKLQVTGPLIDQWPPPSIRTTYDSNEIPNLADPKIRQRTVLRFAKRAFRRNVTEGEIQNYFTFLEKHQANGSSWHEATIKTFAAMMSSVDFLYIREQSHESQQGELDSFELANRLSYFFWSTMPDGELFQLAESGQLKDPAVLGQQVSRLLSDSRSNQFSSSFATQWLALDKLGTMPPDAKGEFRVYYKDHLQPAMLEETHRYFRHILQENRSVRDFLDSDYTFVNQALARHYGISFNSGGDKQEFRRIKFPPSAKRGGLLGHASILTLSANGVETSPIERGVWVLTELLGTPPPPPPKAVPALTPDLNGAVTVRQMLEKHRSDKACMECHRRMDPLGFALEAFDPIGRFRTNYSKRQQVSTHGNFLGREFADVVELKRILASDLRPFTRNLLIRIAEYAKGRKLVAKDFATIEAILTSTEKANFRLKDLVTRLATSNLMTHR